MNRVTVWNANGDDILGQFDSLEEAETWIEESGYSELIRTTSGRQTNIAVTED